MTVGKLRKLFAHCADKDENANSSGQNAFAQALIALLCEECDAELQNSAIITPDKEMDQRIFRAVIPAADGTASEDSPPEKLRRVRLRMLLIAALLAIMLLATTVSASLIIRYKLSFKPNGSGHLIPVFSNVTTSPQTTGEMSGLKRTGFLRGFYKFEKSYSEMIVFERWENREGERIIYIKERIPEQTDGDECSILFGPGKSPIKKYVVNGIEVSVFDYGDCENYVWYNDCYLISIQIDKSIDDICRAVLIRENVS